jgi:hypothetical protein
MDLRKILLFASMTVLASAARGEAPDTPGESGASVGQAEASGSLAGQLFYDYELAPLAAEIEFAPDFDSKVILTVATFDASAGAPLVKVYMNNAKGFERSLVLDLSSGLLSSTEAQAGKQKATQLAPPRLEPEMGAVYAELLDQLASQVAAVRDGKSPKDAPHPELDGLVAYLGKVTGEVRASVESQGQR